jgi:transposase
MAIIGIDVSKDKLDCFWLKDAERCTGKSKVFRNTTSDFPALVNWMVTQTGEVPGQLHVVMEATGVYHEALAYALHAAGLQVSVVNPAWVRDYAKGLGVRTKTDKQDSQVLARLGAREPLRRWQPEPVEIRTLKALLARYEMVKRDHRRELNRLEKAKITQVSEIVLESIHTLLAELEKEQTRLEKLIRQHIDQHPTLKQDRALLESIPGIGPVVSALMLAVLRSHTFRSAGQCAAFLGLVPVQHESGSSVRNPARLSKAGDATVRAKLYMAAVVAIQHNPDIRRHYQRLLKNGKSKMAALGAAMRKLVHICFGVLKHQKTYQARNATAGCA